MGCVVCGSGGSGGKNHYHNQSLKASCGRGLMTEPCGLGSWCVSSTSETGVSAVTMDGVSTTDIYPSWEVC